MKEKLMSTERQNLDLSSQIQQLNQDFQAKSSSTVVTDSIQNTAELTSLKDSIDL